MLWLSYDHTNERNYIMDSIIFDVDGTLWDSADSVAAAWNLAIKKFSSLDITLDRKFSEVFSGKQ